VPATPPPPTPGAPGAPGKFQGSARDGAIPAGVKPLPIDLFTTQDFYKDKALWSNKLYFRCNSPAAIEEQWGAIGQRLIPDLRPPFELSRRHRKGMGVWLLNVGLTPLSMEMAIALV